MVENDLYLAMREGRVPIDVQLEQEGETWVAKYDDFGITAEARHDDSGQAQSDLIERVLEMARDGQGVVERSY